MITAIYILAAIGIAVLACTAFLIAYLVVAVRLDKRAEAKRRAEQGREVTPEWLAVLAATEPTPVYDALVCEQMERAEGWA